MVGLSHFVSAEQSTDVGNDLASAVPPCSDEVLLSHLAVPFSITEKVSRANFGF